MRGPSTAPFPFAADETARGNRHLMLRVPYTAVSVTKLHQAYPRCLAARGLAEKAPACSDRPLPTGGAEINPGLPAKQKASY